MPRNHKAGWLTLRQRTVISIRSVKSIGYIKTSKYVKTPQDNREAGQESNDRNPLEQMISYLLKQAECLRSIGMLL